MATLTSSGTFPIANASTYTATADVQVLPSVSFPNGLGRLIHPTLGAYDYQYKPDQWVNIDGDVIIAPTWSGTKTLGGAAHALYLGNIADVVCEERWLSAGGLAMPIAMLRMLMAIWLTPVDPAVGYVQWYPSYTTNLGYNVIPADLVVGSAGGSQLARLSGIGTQVISLDDVIHAVKADCSPNGWVTTPVTLFLKIVSQIEGII